MWAQLSDWHKWSIVVIEHTLSIFWVHEFLSSHLWEWKWRWIFYRRWYWWSWVDPYIILCGNLVFFFFFLVIILFYTCTFKNHAQTNTANSSFQIMICAIQLYFRHFCDFIFDLVSHDLMPDNVFFYFFSKLEQNKNKLSLKSEKMTFEIRTNEPQPKITGSYKKRVY